MPPVELGEKRRIRITQFGREGDGIGHVNGFVIVVPEAGIGQRVTVEIEAVHDNFAIASVVEDEPDWLFRRPP